MGLTDQWVAHYEHHGKASAFSSTRTNTAFTYIHKGTSTLLSVTLAKQIYSQSTYIKAFQNILFSGRIRGMIQTGEAGRRGALGQGFGRQKDVSPNKFLEPLIHTRSNNIQLLLSPHLIKTEPASLHMESINLAHVS